MENFKTKIEGSDIEYNFECYPNTEPIEMGDYYIFFFAGIADVKKCYSENEKIEINKNGIQPKHNTIDFVSGFWRSCYKIKNTDLNLETLNL